MVKCWRQNPDRRRRLWALVQEEAPKFRLKLVLRQFPLQRMVAPKNQEDRNLRGGDEQAQEDDCLHRSLRRLYSWWVLRALEQEGYQTRQQRRWERDWRLWDRSWSR